MCCVRSRSARMRPPRRRRAPLCPQHRRPGLWSPRLPLPPSDLAPLSQLHRRAPQPLPPPQYRHPGPQVRPQRWNPRCAGLRPSPRPHRQRLRQVPPRCAQPYRRYARLRLPLRQKTALTAAAEIARLRAGSCRCLVRPRRSSRLRRSPPGRRRAPLPAVLLLAQLRRLVQPLPPARQARRWW